MVCCVAVVILILNSDLGKLSGSAAAISEDFQSERGEPQMGVSFRR